MIYNRPSSILLANFHITETGEHFVRRHGRRSSYDTDEKKVAWRFWNYGYGCGIGLYASAEAAV